MGIFHYVENYNAEFDERKIHEQKLTVQKQFQIVRICRETFFFVVTSVLYSSVSTVCVILQCMI